MTVQFVLNENEIYNAFYRLSDIEGQMTAYVTDVTRATVCTRLLDEVYTDKTVISASVRERVGPIMSKYGFYLVAVLVNEVTPAAKVMQAMNQIENFKRAKVAMEEKAEAEKTSCQNNQRQKILF